MSLPRKLGLSLLAVFVILVVAFLVLDPFSEPRGDATRKASPASVDDGGVTRMGDGMTEMPAAPDPSQLPPDATAMDGEPLSVELERVYGIEGRVTTVDGAAIRGAQVQVQAFEPTLFAHQALEFLGRLSLEPSTVVSVQTDGGGFFEALLPRPGRFQLTVSADGYATAVEGPIVVHRGEPRVFLSIPLPSGYEIHGRVVYGDSMGAAGAVVHAMEKGAGFRVSTHRAVADAQGKFVLSGLESKIYTLMVPALRAGFAGCLVPGVTPPSEDVEVRLGEEVVFAGRVVDEGNRRAVAGARITALNPVSYQQVLSDADGRFELALSGPDASVIVEADGYLVLERNISLVAKGEAAGETTETILRLDQGAVLTGQVVYPGGKPAAGVEVGVLQATGFLGSLHLTKTDASGHFELAGVDSNKRGLILPRLAGWWLPWQRAADFSASTYELAPTGALSGQVVDNFERGLARAWVQWSPHGDSSDLLRRATHWLRGDKEVWADDRGFFEIHDVIPIAEQRIAAAHPDAADGQLLLASVDAEPILLRLPVGGTLLLRLSAGDGLLPEAAVVIGDWAGNSAVRRRPSGALEGGVRYLADSRGRVLIEHVPPGETVLHVLCEGFAEERVECTITSEELTERDVQLQPASHLVVSLSDSQGAAVPMARVVLESVDGSYTSQRRTGADGIADFSALRPGSYRLKSSDRQRSWSARTVEIGAEPLRLEIEIDAPQSPPE